MAWRFRKRRGSEDIEKQKEKRIVRHTSSRREEEVEALRFRKRRGSEGIEVQEKKRKEGHRVAVIECAKEMPT